jgi:transposase-like protein
MGRPKGGTNKCWSKEEKYEVILPIINLEISMTQRAKELQISKSMVIKWFNQYLEGGIDSLENKRKPGNPMAKYSRRKELTYTEQLEYENMKLRIENERLKKGYTSKEADLSKQKKSNKRNME